jgi:hypothetical protein
MIKMIWFIVISLLTLKNSDSSYAYKIKCPSVQQVKSVKFIEGTQNQSDPTCWDFISTPFTDSAGRDWNVTFGTFLPTAKTQDEALREGQAYFDSSPLDRQHPSSDKINKHLTLCEYMPTGRLYWVFALSPPQLK